MSTQPSGPPVKPQPPCGGLNQPPCPPVPTVKVGEGQTVHDGTPLYSRLEMLAHGAICYERGYADAARELNEAQAALKSRNGL